MDVGKFRFGSIAIDGVTYEHDLVIDCGKIHPREKKRPVIGAGRYGALPVMDEVRVEARRRRVNLLVLPTDEAIEALAKRTGGTNAILHVTC